MADQRDDQPRLFTVPEARPRPEDLPLLEQPWPRDTSEQLSLPGMAR